MNSKYYNKIREYIYENFYIVNILTHNNKKFKDTQQNVSTFIFQNNQHVGKNNNDFIIKFKDRILFTDKKNILNKLLENTDTLNDLNFNVKTGNVVWNQNKDKLTDDNSKTFLIYTNNIKNKKLKFDNLNNKNENKKQYINIKGTKNPVIVVNRGYGIGKYNFNYCLINIDKEFLLENHLNYIYYTDKNIEKEKLIEKFNKIIKSFNNNKTKEFIEIYSGNGAISSTELKYIIPIYRD